MGSGAGVKIVADITTGGAWALPVPVDLVELNGDQLEAETMATEDWAQFVALLHRCGHCSLDLGPDGTGLAVLRRVQVEKDTLQAREVHRLVVNGKKIWTAWHGVHRWE